MRIPILGSLNLKELLILGGSALAVYYLLNKSKAADNDDKVPAAVQIANTPTNPVPPFREMQRISAFNTRSSGCGCGGA